MTKRVEGKTVLVTAAGAGIGRASALMLAREGAKVFATDVDMAALESLKGEAGGLDLVIDRLDVTSDGAVAAMASKIGPVQGLLNCAGFVSADTVLTCEEKAWDFSFELNAKAMFRTIRNFLPGMLEAGRGGSIVNMASVCSSVTGLPNRFAYGASKAAVIGLTKSVAADFVAQGVRCNAICPGTVESPSLRGRIQAQAEKTGRTLDEVRADFVARQPMGRLGRPEEVAALVTYLISDEAAFTTGSIHLVDGGLAI
jgi:2-keto-3-deoxy-L-fuconate dehydrogenase